MKVDSLPQPGRCACCRTPMFAQTFVDSAIPWAIIAGVRLAPWDRFDYVALGREWAAGAPRFA